MRKIFIFLGLFIHFSVLFVSADIYDDFYAFKVQLYNAKDKSHVASLIAEWEQKIAKMQLNEEEKLTLSNFLVLEKVSILNKDKDKKKIYKLIKVQNNSSEKFMEGKKHSSLNKWFLLSFGDVKSRYISYISWLNVYSESKAARQCYQDALKRDSSFSPAYLSEALWLFFAPAIAGGSYENALKQLNSALSCAKNNNEKYLALIFRSQVHHKMGNSKKCKEDLEEASKLIDGERFTQHIANLNTKENKVFFE